MSVRPLQSKTHKELSFVPFTLMLPQLYPVQKPARARDVGLLPVKDCGNDPEKLWVSTRSLFPPELPTTLELFLNSVTSCVSIQIFCIFKLINEKNDQQLV